MQNKDKSRRFFLKLGLASTASAVFGKSVHGQSILKINPTPSEIEGPFYPVMAQKDKDFDLTQIEGKEGKAKGKIITIEGQITDTNGVPLEDATVDLWQANSAGRYRHPRDPNDAPLDPSFQGWAIVPSGREGGFRFQTVYPGTYPAAAGWTRPPHLHFKVSKLGYVELITQMYFPDHALNETDLLLQSKSTEEQSLMIAKLSSKSPETYRYNIALSKA
ncbi:Protocatechuate 3,4-dioxygenase beta chain [Acaryochloris thomasi RCC1774]|uniref:Protocatechuate 3,4-dioxygenase beta chain n=1 Tax=Acaryochloris thomasi RCC1774 TaxID=1764569 RepID=A0A2W1JB01_9CYAN|nr:protocatechuate 3,4-dioxygenase [Acaryochloris thomasi]PZD71289.1 Protocatechuate 3,4-dioxygenase beta chain [Acaryochloris thomasi RCC1774]